MSRFPHPTPSRVLTFRALPLDDCVLVRLNGHRFTMAPGEAEVLAAMLMMASAEMRGDDEAAEVVRAAAPLQRLGRVIASDV